MQKATEIPVPTREFTIEEIEAFVRDLESLLGGGLSAAALIGSGERAIPPLRIFLLTGRPSGIYQPRQLAVETLAQLGAKDVLLEYLNRWTHIEDAVVRMGEDAVRSTAARELGRWKTEDVFECLTRLALDHLLPGVVEALGTFRRAETIPYFLWALGDGVCRTSAVEAIRGLGEAARPALIAASNAPSPSYEEENGSSLQRRRWVLRILVDMKVTERDWQSLRDRLDESDSDIVITAARIALHIGSERDKQRAIRRMLERLPSADWFLQMEVRSALTEHFDVAAEKVEDEIERRIKEDSKEQTQEVLLRLLFKLRLEKRLGARK